MGSGITLVYAYLGDACYLFLGAVALWGAYCVIIVWRRVSQIRFRSEEVQDEFLGRVEGTLMAGDLQSALSICEGDNRVIPQLVQLALLNRNLGPVKLKHFLADRFQRDVLADLEHRISWIVTVIKSAPMLGLFGTVLGMMAAFGKLSSGNKVEPAQLADDISLALITTALGLAIAIPLTICIASINIRIAKMEDLVRVGLTRFMDNLKIVMTHNPLSGE